MYFSLFSTFYRQIEALNLCDFVVASDYHAKLFGLFETLRTLAKLLPFEN